MCGQIRKGTQILQIREGFYIPKELIVIRDGERVRRARRKISISSHRFMKQERLGYWHSQYMNQMWRVQIDADSFCERGKWFTREGLVIAAYLHQDMRKLLKISLITTPSDEIVRRVHDRMPLMEEPWYSEAAA